MDRLMLMWVCGGTVFSRGLFVGVPGIVAAVQSAFSYYTDTAHPRTRANESGTTRFGKQPMETLPVVPRGARGTRCSGAAVTGPG